jgi:hypothetical protein
MARVLGYNGATCCSLAQVQPYLNYLFNLPASYNSAALSLGMYPLPYGNASVVLKSSGSSVPWSTLQDNPQYISTDCLGNIISNASNNSANAELTNITAPGWQSIWNSYYSPTTFSPSPQTFFMDGASDPNINSNYPSPATSWLPCGVSDSQYVAGLAMMFAGNSFNLIVNSIYESNNTGTNWHTVVSPSNVIGAMADSDCYVVGPQEFGANPADEAVVQSMHEWSTLDAWSQKEDDELYLASQGKQFWCLIAATGIAAQEKALRVYAYASLMLTFSLPSTGYFTTWKTNDSTQVEIYPETAIVPVNPLVQAPSDISALKVSGVYVREYEDCFYSGVDQGPCAFVVNPTTGSQTVPTLSEPYTNTVALSGGGTLEGGSLSFAGPAPASTLPSGTAQIETIGGAARAQNKTHQVHKTIKPR